MLDKLKAKTKEKKKKVKKKKSPEESFFKRLLTRFSVKEQTIFAKRLALLVRAGVPILEGLRLLKKGKSKLKTEVLDRIIEDVEQGKYLHTSMGRFKHIFGDFAINIIKVGEASGILDQNLDYLAEELKKKYALRRKILSALVYPVFIMLATLGLTVMLLVFVLPRIMPIFESLNVRLPITTRILIFVSNFLINYGLYLLLAIIILIILFIILKKKWKKFDIFIDRSLVEIPLLGRIVQGYQLTNFCRTMGLLLKSGIRINDAVQILSDTTENSAYKEEYYKLSKTVSKGKPISSELERNLRLFPDIAIQMIAIGERTGELSDTLIFLASMYEEEVDELTKNLSSALEPVLMVFIGVIVGFTAISIITPIYEITKGLTPR